MTSQKHLLAKTKHELQGPCERMGVTTEYSRPGARTVRQSQVAGRSEGFTFMEQLFCVDRLKSREPLELDC